MKIQNSDVAMMILHCLLFGNMIDYCLLIAVKRNIIRAHCGHGMMQNGRRYGGAILFKLADDGGTNTKSKALWELLCGYFGGRLLVCLLLLHSSDVYSGVACAGDDWGFMFHHTMANLCFSKWENESEIKYTVLQIPVF